MNRTSISTNSLPASAGWMTFAALLCLAPIIVGCSRSSQSSSGGPLGVGDPAPPLQIAQWVNNKPASTSFDGKVHVVEFWATWCGPCRVGMPHISALQTEYGDEVTIIGVTDEDLGTVEGFLVSESADGRPWSDVITYHLALDDNGAMNASYMRAANQNGIPTAFIVGREGLIEWIGHPGRIDEPLNQIVSGSWNREAAAKEIAQQQKIAESGVQMNKLIQAGDWDGALALIDKVEESVGPSAILMHSRLSVLQSAGRSDEAAAIRVKVVDAGWDNAMLLNSLAWDMATAASDHDLKLALKAAQRSSELTDAENPAVLDTLARVHYELGDLEEAISWQRKAVELNVDRAEIDEALEKYLAEQGEIALAASSDAEDS